MFGIGTVELLIVLAMALIFIGPRKLPQLARSLGRSWREFQKAKDELIGQVDQVGEEWQNPASEKSPEKSSDRENPKENRDNKNL